MCFTGKLNIILAITKANQSTKSLIEEFGWNKGYITKDRVRGIHESISQTRGPYPFLHGGEEDAGAVSVNGLISSLTPAAAPGLHTAFLTR